MKIGSDVTDEEKEKAGEHGVTVMTYKDLYAEGEANPVPHNPPQPEDIATICYTSGTTGQFPYSALFQGPCSMILPSDCIPSWFVNVRMFLVVVEMFI